MKQTCKIYNCTFKEMAVELSLQRTNVSELVRELGINTPQLYKMEKGTH
jgi:transposase-like protein